MLSMFDSVNVTEIPRDAQAVAGYVNGKWPTYWTLVTQFPHAHKLSIAVNVHRDADCLDVERGDAVNSEAPGWVKRQLAGGARRPAVYTSVSNAQALVDELARHGVRRSQYRLWTAHYTEEHLCDSRCGFGFRGKADATQYSDHALGRNLDESLCAPDFFGVPAKRKRLSRRQLRARILGWHRHGVTWKRIKATKAWRLYRILRGR